MAQSNNTEQGDQSLWRTLLQRRVLQIIGIYIAAGWGIIQFVDWIVNRYVLSPHLTDLALIILLSLIPSMLIVAYFHGRPGRDRWTRVEKITIPVNVLVTAAIIIMFSSGRDLGAVQQKVTLKNESGQQLEKLIPKSQFRKKLAIFYFENQSGDKALNWLQYAVPDLLGFDLSQDLFLEVGSLRDLNPNTMGSFFHSMAKEAGYPLGLNIPLGVKRKLAQEMHKDFILDGTIKKSQGKWAVTTSLYKTRNSSLVARRTFQDRSPFNLVDQLSVQLKRDLDIPAGHIKEVIDLPIEEMYTKSMDACRLFTLGKNAMVIKSDWSAAEKFMQKALKRDPDFALAYDAISTILLMTNRLGEWIKSYGPLMKHLNKLPQRHQLFAKVGYYQAQQDVPRTLAVLKMITQMYPQDMQAYSILASLYSVYNKPADAVEVYNKMLKIDPLRYQVHKKIAGQYQSLGKYDLALEHLEIYKTHFPDRTESFTLIGDLKGDMGQYAEGSQYYEKALLLAPGDVSIQLKIVRNELKSGHLDAALKQYTALLEACKTDKERARVHGGLVGYYHMTGQMNKALEHLERRLDLMANYTPPVLMLEFRIVSIDYYIKAGREKEAWDLIRNLKKNMPPSLKEKMAVADMVILLDTGTADEIEKMLPTLESLDRSYGKETLGLLLNLARGKVAELKGQYTQARQYYSQQLKLKPNSISAKRKIAWCYRKENQPDKAEILLKEIHKVEPFEPQINLNLAELYWQMDKKDLARKHLKIAAKVWQQADPRYKPAQRVKELLAEWQL